MIRGKSHRKFQAILLILSFIGLLFIFFMPSLFERASAPAALNNPVSTQPTPNEQAIVAPSPSPIIVEPTPPPEPVYAEAVWMAVGDVMMHKPQLPGAYNKATKSYNFDSFSQRLSQS